MHKLIVLVDVDGENVDQLIGSLKSSGYGNVWVGCSSSSGKDTQRIFRQFPSRSVSLFPGTFSQVLSCKRYAKSVYVVYPQNCRRFSSRIKMLVSSAYVKLHPERDLWVRMKYFVLSPNSKTARRLGVDRSVDEDEILGSIREDDHGVVFLEAGSRNRSRPITDYLGLMGRIKQKCPRCTLIVNGGITEPAQARSAARFADYVVVSHALHMQPERLQEYIKASETK